MRSLIKAAQYVHSFGPRSKVLSQDQIFHREINQERVKSVCNKSVVQKPSIIKDASFCDYKVKE